MSGGLAFLHIDNLALELIAGAELHRRSPALYSASYSAAPGNLRHHFGDPLARPAAAAAQSDAQEGRLAGLGFDDLVAVAAEAEAAAAGKEEVAAAGLIGDFGIERVIVRRRSVAELEGAVRCSARSESRMRNGCEALARAVHCMGKSGIVIENGGGVGVGMSGIEHEWRFERDGVDEVKAGAGQRSQATQIAGQRRGAFKR